jgi:hypothetical protein
VALDRVADVADAIPGDRLLDPLVHRLARDVEEALRFRLDRPTGNVRAESP